MKRWDLTICKKCIYTALSLLFVMGPVAAAGDNPSDLLDINFWFKALMTGLLSILIWFAKNTDIRLKEVENKSIAQMSLNATTSINIDNISSRYSALEIEQRQIVSMINMQREMMLTKYHDKEDTERHRQHVEHSLEGIAKDIKDLNDRLNGLNRRRQGD